MDINAIAGQPVFIGRHGENEYRRVLFDVSGYLADRPGASFVVLNRLPGEASAYPAASMSLDGGTLAWTVSAADTSKPGTGECELIVSDGDVVSKSVIYTTKIGRALDGAGSAPPEWETWQGVFAQYKSDAEDAADSAADDAGRAETALSSLYNVVADKVNKPTDNPNGYSGQILRTNGDGSTEWADFGLPTDGQTRLAVHGWLDSHPEATTTVQDHSIEIKKLTGGAQQKLFPALQIGIDSISTRAKWADGELEHYFLQSVCYDSTRDRYIVGCSHDTDADQSKLFILDGFSFANEPEAEPILPLYKHCNDMTYDAVTDHIYIAGGSNKIYEIKAEDLSYVGTHEVDPAYGVWQISAFSDGTFAVGVYDTQASEERLLHYNSSFTQSVVISNGYESAVNNFFGISSCVQQGSFVYDDVPYIIFNEREASGIGTLSCIIASFDSSGVTLARRMRTRFEVECACVVDGKIHWLMGNDWIGTGVTDLMAPEIYPQQPMQIEIPSGADLDDYIYEGYYYSPVAAVSNTLYHMPNSTSKLGGFTLSVIRQAADFVRQIMYSNTYGTVENMYTRVIYGSTTSPWYTFVLTPSDNAQN